MSKDQTNSGQQELKEQVIFDSFSAHAQESSATRSQNIRPAEVIGQEIQWQAESTAETKPVTPAETAPSSDYRGKHFTSKWLWLSVFVIGLAVAELVIFIDSVLSQQDWLSAGWLVVLTIVSLLALRQVVKEWRGLAKLKKHERLKQQASALLSAPTIGQGERFCKQLEADFKPSYPLAIESWKKSLKPHHLDNEVLMLFDLHVVSEADKVALKHITRHASASAAMIAVSPFALLDMGVVLWRNLVMLKQISQCYGIQLTYWGRIHLIKSVFKTMLVAGAAEILSDAGNYALGAGITGKLSSRVAQGLGAGVLTSRIGIKAMHACRPLPWLAQQPPGISKLAQQLLSDLNKLRQ
ncbi:TIGR01620 family protein [Aliiglaciecola litoralis]|uniref:TIGR01620 family protein n=1 Tax=Aliiglaciecola litoralis TaxID=582857 RepID=A0ABN1LLZ0_9ALTE